LIQPNEYQIVMDYVIPQIIKIFDIDTVLIVDIQFYELGKFDGILKFNKAEASNLDNRDGNDNADFLKFCYYLKDDRYLVQNVPWDIYPILYNERDCPRMSEHMERISNNERQEFYRVTTDGFAIIQFWEINAEAACFAQ